MLIRAQNREGETTLHIPFKVIRRGGRKLIVVPDGIDFNYTTERRNPAMIKAVARAFRWRRMLNESTHATIGDIARSEVINQSYISRILRLTLLAPEIVEAILDGRQPITLQLDKLLTPFPLAWSEQLVFFGFGVAAPPSSASLGPDNRCVRG